MTRQPPSPARPAGPNRQERRRRIAAIQKAPDIAQRFAADMKVATGLHKQGRVREAADLYRRITKAYADHPEVRIAWSNLGAALQGLGRLDDAVHALKKARALRPDQPAPHHNLGMALLNRGDLPEAAESLERAATLDPGFADAWVGLGLVRQRTGDLPGAEEAWERALAARPDLVEPRFNLATLYARSGRREAALAAFRACLERQPRFPEAVYAIGRLLEEAGDFAGAAGQYLEALRLVPGVEAIHDQLGLALRALARSDAATARTLAETWRTAFPQNAAAARMVAALTDGLSAQTGGEPPVGTVSAPPTTAAPTAVPTVEAPPEAAESRVPELLKEAVAAALPPAAGALSVLDAGCGDGLLGSWLKPYAATLVGVDTSPARVAGAGDRGLYDRLEARAPAEHLADTPAAYDLVVAGDLLPALGDVGPLFAAVAGALETGGVFAAATEALAATGGVELRPSGRYAHSEAHLRSAAEAAGLAVSDLARETLRLDGGVPVDGFVLVARKRPR